MYKRQVFVLEQKINLINEDKGILTLCTVLCDTVQDRVKDNKHCLLYTSFVSFTTTIEASLCPFLDVLFGKHGGKLDLWKFTLPIDICLLYTSRWV